MENKHTYSDLVQMRSLPLEAKIRMTQQRIKAWYEYWDGLVYEAFSGGIDSTVLKHIIDSMYSNVPAVFTDTGLEYPEIRRFVIEVKGGKYDCFNSDIEIIRPEMRFDQVIKEYGYPVVSKAVSRKISDARKGLEHVKKYFLGTATDKYGNLSRFNCAKWKYLIDSPFKVSHKCCDVMKKNPFSIYEKETKRKPYIGTMASESTLREKSWMKTGCNAFYSKKPKSQPLSFWTKQDVLEYIVKYNVPYASVYGQIQEEGELEGQMFIDGFHAKLCTSGVDRTGCMFCMFGCHLEKEPNRFQRLKKTHPRQYEYCIGGGEMVDGKWQPNKDGLGLGKVLDFIGVKY